MELKPGDIFFKSGGTLLDSVINFFQSLWSGDNRSVFTHTGVVLDCSGNTFETSEWRTGSYNLSASQGRKTVVAIFRHGMMGYTPAIRGCVAVDYLNGWIYPYWRLPLFALGLAKFIHGRNRVCSELVAAFLNATGMRSRPAWGVSVDQLIDEIHGAPGWELIYLGFGWEGNNVK
jgi:hypothetical protein